MTLEELARQAGTVVSIVGVLALIVAVAIVGASTPRGFTRRESRQAPMYAAIGVVILAFLVLLIINNR